MSTQGFSSIPVWRVTKPYIEVDCALGEAPHFEESLRTFRFVDIEGKKLHRFHVDRGASSLETIETKDSIGVTADIEGDDEQIIVGAKYGFATLNRVTGHLQYIARAYEQKDKAERMRSNDGAVDPTGRFLVGTMTDHTLHKVEKEGTLFRLAASSSASSGYVAHTVVDPVTIPNGLAWSPDGSKMYHTDSPTYTIWKYDYDVAMGTATNPRPWFVMRHLDEQPGKEMPPDAGPVGCEPDGFAFDVNGDLWSAVYGAGKVLRIRDIGGRGVVVGCITLPAANTTCPRFVDEDLVITSARGGGEYGGCVFRVHVGVQGAPERRWKPDA